MLPKHVLSLIISVYSPFLLLVIVIKHTLLHRSPVCLTLLPQPQSTVHPPPVSPPFTANLSSLLRLFVPGPRVASPVSLSYFAIHCIKRPHLPQPPPPPAAPALRSVGNPIDVSIYRAPLRLFCHNANTYAHLLLPLVSCVLVLRSARSCSCSCGLARSD